MCETGRKEPLAQPSLCHYTLYPPNGMITPTDEHLKDHLHTFRGEYKIVNIKHALINTREDVCKDGNLQGLRKPRNVYNPHWIILNY